jgi:hypothetical protein
MAERQSPLNTAAYSSGGHPWLVHPARGLPGAGIFFTFLQYSFRFCVYNLDGWGAENPVANG